MASHISRRMLALSVCLLPALAAVAGEKASIEWSVRPEAVTAGRGQTVTLDVDVTIADGWHIYSTKDYGPKGPAVAPTTIVAGPPALLQNAGPIAYSKPTLAKVEGVEVEVFEKTATFHVPVQVSRDATPGDHTAALAIDAQACSDTACVPFFGKRATFTLRVTQAAVMEAASPVAPATGAPAPPSVPGRTEKIAAADGAPAEIEAARQEGLWAYLALSLSLGAASLLTPCVFPMVPITVSFFTKRKHVSHARAVRDAAVYALGIITTFVGLGALFTLLLGATGIRSFAANPWVNLFIAAVFTAFALTLLGAFEIGLPDAILSRLSAAARRGEGIGSVVLMGLLFSFTSFTCTVPFIGASLFSATQGEWAWPLIGMAGFATAFSAPFFVLALFPSLLKALPKSGGWPNSVKVVMGFLELAAAAKFVSNTDLAWGWGLLTREAFLSFWIALALLSAVYVLGFIRFAHDSVLERVGALRALFAAGFLAFAFWLASGLAGQGLGELEAYVPPKAQPGAELSWHDNWDAALAEAKSTGKPVLADFTGITCTNCRWMETNIFPQHEVAEVLKGFVRVRLFTDKRGTAEALQRSLRNQQMQEERFKTVALPFYAIIGPDDTVRATFPGLTRDAREFVRFLQSGLR